jgi:arylsulfatase B
MKGAEACKTGPDNCTGTCAFDFWRTSAPATGYDDEYSASVYSGETVKVIEASAEAGAKPFFVYLAFANTHEPLEAPPQFQARYPPTMRPKSRMMLGAMASAMDEAVGSIADALKATKLWGNTLLVWAADNGGPTGVGDVAPKAAACAANNFPLRGGKGSAFQGGVRTAGFVVGGLLPAAVQGTKYEGYIHVAECVPDATLQCAGLQHSRRADTLTTTAAGLQRLRTSPGSQAPPRPTTPQPPARATRSTPGRDSAAGLPRLLALRYQ